MLAALLSNARTIGITTATLVVFLSGIWVGKQISKDGLKTALERQMIELVAKCESDKETTRKIGEEYEAKISTLNSRVANLRRMSATRCVPVARSSDAAHGSTAAGLPNVDGVHPSELIDLAAEAEKQRQQLISLQDFVRGLR